MIRKLTALLAALAFVGATFAPAAEARDRHDGYRGGHYDNHRGGRYRDDYYRHDRGDAVAAGAVGLILGLAIGSLASQPREPQGGYCSDNYRRCAPPPPPPRCSDRCGGYNNGYQDQRYDPRYDDRRGSAYDQDYDLDGGPAYEQRGGCTRTERQYDRYARQYVMVDVPC